MIKAVFFDIDGTLKPYQTEELPRSVERSLVLLKSKKIKIFVATGRHLTEMSGLPDIFKIFDGYVTLNGQIGLNEKREFLFGYPLQKEISEALIRIFKEKEFPLALIEEKKMYLNFADNHVAAAHRAANIKPPEEGTYKSERLYQAIAFIERKLDKKLRNKLPSGCKLTRWNDYGVDIISEFGGKAIGLKAFQERFGFRKEEIMAFGDAENDMDMLKYAGIGVAMGNAERKVREAADHVTALPEEDGIEKALRYFGLL